MDFFLQDLRYALRAMRRDAGFCALAILILGLGIGANTAIFSVVNTLLLRPLPFQDASRLVWIANTGNTGLSGATSRVANYRDWRTMNQSFVDITSYFAFSDYSSYTMKEAGEPERLSGFGVAQNFFDLLGVRLMLGRPFDNEEAKWNGRKAVILTHGLWERRFGSDPKIIGRRLTLNDEATTVVGVTPRDFDFASVFTPGAKVDMLVPFPLTDETDRWGNTLAVIGRLKPGVTVAQAQAEFSLLSEQILSSKKDRYQFGARLTALQDQVSGPFRRALLVLLGAVAVVLLIACANLSNLLLARAASRRKEIAVRTALGAMRSRLIRQMLTESLVLSCCGALLGLALAFAATRAFSGLEAMNIPLLLAVHVDGTAMLFTLAVALGTGLLFGLAPALQLSGSKVHEALKDSSRGSSQGRHGAWVRGALVVSEIALACVLLVGAGLLMRSFLRVLDVNLGFQPAHTAVWTIDTSGRFKTNTQQNAFVASLRQSVQALPGVESTGATDCLPLGRNRSWNIRAKGQTYRPGETPLVYPRLVSPGYIGAMKIPLRAGRDFSDHDTEDSQPVMVVNETLARRVWPGKDPMGQEGFVTDPKRPARVIGVVGDVRHSSLEESGGAELYLPLSQVGSSSVEFVVRTKLAPEALAPAVRAALRQVDPGLPTAEFRTLEDVVDRAASPRRFVVVLLGGFALLALLLASLGIYGVVSYSVNQRTQEIGIRMALGASSGHMQLRVLRETVILALTGSVLGVIGSVGVARLLESLLFGVRPGDILTFASMTLLLTGVAALAGYLPARRASRIDPMSALRSE